MTKYLPRVVDAELAERLSATGAVVVEGPKACGKTATAETVAASAAYLDVDATAREMVGRRRPAWPFAALRNWCAQGAGPGIWATT